MVLIGLLLIALVCLALGIILPSNVFLVASLVATAAGAFRLWTARKQLGGSAGKTASPDEAGSVGTSASELAGSRAATDAAAATEDAGDDEVWVVDGAPEFHVPGCAALDGDAEPIPFNQAVEDGFTPCSICKPDLAHVRKQQMHVPDADAAGSSVSIAESASGGAAQLVAEPASADELATAPNDSDGVAGAAAASSPDVWVTDGYPEFHRCTCALLTDEAEPIPYEQAVEDGFTPCDVCAPAADAPSAPVLEPLVAPAEVVQPLVADDVDLETDLALQSELDLQLDSAGVGEVWVIDGHPEYHLAGCAVLTDAAQAVPREQAVEDGFTPCAVCAPEGAADGPDVPEPIVQAAPVVAAAEPVDAPSAATDEGEVWVIDGHPEYHLAGCAVLTDAAQAVPREQAVEDGFTPCAVCEPEGAAETGPGASEPVVEPAFEPAPEPVVEPVVAAVALAAEPAPVGQDTADDAIEVWVVDGRPDYHIFGCSVLGAESQTVPLMQAVEDGFTPCQICEPDLALADGVSVYTPPPPAVAEPDLEPAVVPEPEPAVVPEPEPVAVPEPEPTVVPEPEPEPEPVAVPEPEPVAVPEPEPEPVAVPEPVAAAEAVVGRSSLDSDVWVVDGRPRFHLSDCMMIKGREAMPVSYEQAVEDGFMPCSLCEPSAVRTS